MFPTDPAAYIFFPIAIVVFMLVLYAWDKLGVSDFFEDNESDEDEEPEEEFATQAPSAYDRRRKRHGPQAVRKHRMHRPLGLSLNRRNHG